MLLPSQPLLSQLVDLSSYPASSSTISKDLWFVLFNNFTYTDCKCKEKSLLSSFQKSLSLLLLQWKGTSNTLTKWFMQVCCVLLIFFVFLGLHVQDIQFRCHFLFKMMATDIPDQSPITEDVLYGETHRVENQFCDVIMQRFAG